MLKSDCISISCPEPKVPAVFIISDMAYKPTNTVKTSKPELNWILLNVNLSTESTGAKPTVANIIPKTPAISPLLIELPAKLAINVSENKVTLKYSQGPNLIVSFASWGATKIKAAILNIVPMAENTIPTPIAFPASPFKAIGLPSKQVAIEEGVPGILSKIAEINPPEIPPIYKATNIEIPAVADKEY